MTGPATANTANTRRRSPFFPKGRQVEPGRLAEVRALLGDRPRRRDLLIEFLHRIQDRFGHISAGHLAALAHDMGLAQAEIYEVATFYAHFDVIKEGESAPPPLTVRVCMGLVCEMAGAQRLRQDCAGLGGGVRIVEAPCVGACDRAPVAVVGKRQVACARADAVHAAVMAGRTDPEIPAYRSFDAYGAGGGYRVMRAAISGQRSRDALLAEVEASGLRGLGGAGFPAGRKWRFLQGAPKPRVLAVNADEGEPGTFKDRWCLDTDPHRLIEGALIAAWAVEAEEIYIYVRDEYAQAHAVLPVEIDKVRAAGLANGVAIHLRRGAGAYICGEESAMLESLEGKRGLPRNRPPFPAERGLNGRPTLIHNVETLFWLREILEQGAEAYQRAGRPRLYSVSGRVARPGVVVAPAAVTARQLVEERAGGMLPGHAFKAYLPGGASGGILPAELADLPLDFGHLEPHGCFVGSAAVIILSDRDDIRPVAANLLRFFEDESCGQCTPCRVGCEKMLALINAPVWDTALIRELSQAMRDASICGLGQAAPNPVLSALRFFGEEVAR
ncbi:MAG: NAD(P)H-dependent oxidoreductase subunit E [Rhodospirillales bacterium]|nr:NAD(P)H-dependent oxidoreductase subunit E [Rhodospirillales bacterium]